MDHVEKLMTGVKRRLAILLVVVMTVQSLLTSANVVAVAAPSGADPENNIFALEGKPDGAFKYIYVQLGTTVSEEGDEISVTYWYELNNEWLEDQFEKHLSDGLVDPYSFKADDGAYYKGLRDTYGTYDNYLLAQDWEVPSFTCSFDDSFADVAELLTILSADSSLYTEKSELIGEVTVEDKNGPQFTIQFNNTIFVRQNIYGNKKMSMKLLNQYDSGTKVEVEKKTGENSLEVIIKGEGTPLASSSNYTIDKDFKQGTNIERDDDPSAINFYITAKATPSSADLASLSVASLSGASLSGASTRIASQVDISTESSSKDDESESQTETDDDDDEIADDARDITLEYDWWNMGLKVPTQSTIVRNALSGSSEYEEGADLVGKYITDAISSNLILDAVEVSYDGGETWVPLSVEDEYGYVDWEEYLSANNRLFTYQIKGDEDNPVWQCDVILYTRIADKLWLEYAQTGTLDYEFPNRAVLKYKEDSGTLTVSDKVIPKIQWSDLLTKKGEIVDIDGTEMQWNIKVDSNFSSGVQLYLVDHIASTSNTHNYIWGEDGIRGTITINDEEEPVIRLTNIDEIVAAWAIERGVSEDDIWNELRYGKENKVPDKDYPYGTPSISTIEALLTFLGLAYNDGTHYAYEYSYAKDGQMVTDAVMLISMKEYTKGETTITYKTEITADPADSTGAYEDVELRNDVRPVWKWGEGGIGPGEMPTGDINVYKTWKIRAKAVDKLGAGYDDATNTIRWLFDVNQTGKDLKHVWIEDRLDPEIQVWSGLGEGETIQLIPYIRTPETDEDDKPIYEVDNNGRFRQVDYVRPEDYEKGIEENPIADIYTIVTETNEEGTYSVLKVHLGQTDPDEYYKFWVQTMVVSPRYAQGKELKITNEATAKVMIGDNPSVEVNLSAEQSLSHALIDKEAIDFEDGDYKYKYNYADNTVKWSVLLNPKEFTISEGKVIDTLPLGTKFDKITGVTVGGAPVFWNYEETGHNSGRIKIADSEVYILLEVTEGLAAYPKDSSGKQYSGDTLVMSFVDSDGKAVEISQTYKLEYTTTVTEDFRQGIIKSNGKGEKLLNHVVLEGFINKAEIQHAESSATHTIQPQALLKEGKYHALSAYTYLYYDDNDQLDSRDMEAVYFNWVAYINRLEEDLKDVTISDTLANCFELVPATFRVEVVKLDEAGNVDETVPPNVIVDKGKAASNFKLTDLELDEYGFRFVVPAEYAESTLKITYDTILVDDATAAEMKNAIKAEGTDWEDSTGEVTDKEAKDFRFDEYNNADGMYFLRVEKISTNDNLKNLYLPGAEFKLTKMQKDSNDPDLKWKETLRVKTRISNSSGALHFLFLEPNTLYKLEEIKAPDGYVHSPVIWYIAILDATVKNGTAEADRDNFPEEGASGDRSVILVNDPDSIDPMHYAKLEINNDPNNEDGTNEFTFRKLGQNGQPLSEVKFRLAGPQMVLSTTSNADGEVRFEKLDPLGDTRYYTLTEVEAPTGYLKAGGWRVFVTRKDGKYQIILKEWDEESSMWIDISEKDDEVWLLRNEEIKNSGSFTKVDQNGDTLVTNKVVFDVFRLGDGGTDTGGSEITVDLRNNEGEYVSYLPQSTVTSNNGIVELEKFYYGYYKLVERTDENIHAEKPANSIYIMVNGSGVYAAGVGSIPQSDKDYTIDLRKPSTYKVKNIIQWGLVDVKKVLATYNEGKWEVDTDDDGNAIPLVDMMFGIHRIGADGKPISKPFMYIKTNSDGNFEMDTKSERYKVYDENGDFDEYRSLLVGTYALKECESGKYECTDDDYYEFTIADGKFDAQEDIYEPPVKVVVSTGYGNEEGEYFLNKPLRHSVNLRKEDKDYSIVLKNAKFEVRNNDGLVAYLIDESGNGEYVLATPGNSPDAVERDKSSNRRYLEKNDEGKYELLVGTYTISEIEAPDEKYEGYYPAYQMADRDNMTALLEVSASGATLIRGNLKKVIVNDTMLNSVKTGGFELKKDVLVLRQPVEHPNWGSYDYKAAAAGFEFTLSGWSLPSQAAKDAGDLNVKEQQYNSTTNELGILSFENIPLGTYKLEETNVPDDYKFDNGIDGDKEWSVKKVDPIWVKITAIDDSSDATTVTFYDEDWNLLEASAAADVTSQSESSIGTGTDSESLLAYNALKVANVTGLKKTFYVGTEEDDSDNKVLEGATFELIHNKLDYKFKCTTADDGLIFFKDVPYGTYRLEETGVPGNYYQPVSFDITISEYTVNIDDEGVSVYNLQQKEGQEVILNEVTLANARFLKLDQNGNKITSIQLPNLQFAVKRISGSITGYPLDEGKTRLYKLDADGYLNITNLAIGIYEVTEDVSALTENEKAVLTADTDAKLVHFWIEVKATDYGQVILSVYDEESLAPLSLKASKPVEHKGLADFTDSDVMSVLMKNVRAYGMVNLKKVRGERLTDDKYQATNQALAGVEFAIYEADSDGNREDTPFIILTTDENGNFPQPEKGTDGIYSGTDEKGQTVSKALMAGNYVMQERSVSDDYVLLSDDIQFTVRDKETTWIYTDTDGKAVASNVEGKTFINVPKRGTLSFDKVDDDSGKYLTDARFAIFSRSASGEAGQRIGTIRYNAIAGTYQIAAAIDPTAQKEGSNIPYLVKDEEGTYYLLAGSYIIKEVEAPKGYHLVDGEIWVTIEDGENTLVTYPSLVDGGTEGIVTNAIQKASLSFVKNVEANSSQVVNGEGTIFILRGQPANATGDWGGREITAGIDGKFIIDNLPLGSYVLSEKAATPNPYQGFGEKTEVDILKIDVSVDESGSLKVSYTIVDTKESDKSPEGITVTVPTPGTADEIVITNNWKRGSITGRKVAADNTAVGLSGAEFGLYTDKDCTSLVKTVTSSTATEPKGQFEFTDIPYGTYYVKEIKAPYGYVPSTIVYQVTVDTQEASIVKGGKLDAQNNVGQPEALIFTNGNKRGAVELTKKAVHNDELLAGSAEFTIYADEACNRAVAYLQDTDRDGTYTLSKSGSGLIAAVNGVHYLQQGENGKLLLIQGTYWLKETTVPAGYQAEMNGSNQKVYKFTIANNDGDNTQLLDTCIITNHGDAKFFYNEMATGQFTLAKTIEVSRADGLTAAGAGFWFKIAGTDAATDNGKKIAESEFLRIGGKTLAEAVAAGVAKNMGDGSIHVVTGSNGTVVVSGLLIGTYTVTELDGPNYYLYTGTTPKQVVLKQSENRAEIITTFANTTVDPKRENLTFHNTLKRSDIKGLKVRTNNRGLAGATIGLFPAGTTDFTEANLYEGITAVSDANGYFVFKSIPYGTYRIAELKAPSGFHLNKTTSYLVSVTENGAEITIGYKEEKLVTETTASEIKIVNTRISDDGGNGGGDPTSPQPGTVAPTEPTTEGTVPTIPEPPTIPDDGRVEVPGDPPAVIVEDSNGDVVYEGPTDNGYIDTSGWPPGTYTLYVLNEEGVPQGQMLITIGDNETPLANLAKAGDTSLPAALLILTMLGAIGGMTALVVKRRKEEE